MPTVAIKSHLWLTWAKIAIRQERRASEARALGEADPASLSIRLGLETEESIQAVVAVRQCLHNLWRVVGSAINAELMRQGQATLSGERWSDPRTFTTSLPYDAKAWEASVLGLIAKRNEAIHYDEEFAASVPHPFYPTNVGGINAAFTVERSSEAVDLMLDVLDRAINHPSPALAKWAEAQTHVLDLLRTMRETGEDF